VKVVGDGQRDKVDLFHREKLAVILKGVRDAAFLGEMLGLPGQAGRNRHHLRIRNQAERGRVKIADVTAADDADFDHVRSPWPVAKRTENDIRWIHSLLRSTGYGLRTLRARNDKSAEFRCHLRFTKAQSILFLEGVKRRNLLAGGVFS